MCLFPPPSFFFLRVRCCHRIAESYCSQCASLSAANTASKEGELCMFVIQRVQVLLCTRAEVKGAMCCMSLWDSGVFPSVPPFISPQNVLFLWFTLRPLRFVLLLPHGWTVHSSWDKEGCVLFSALLHRAQWALIFVENIIINILNKGQMQPRHRETSW